MKTERPLRNSHLLSVFFAIVTAFFILTASIAIPTTWKGFYYAQIKSLRIQENTGYSLETIKTAYSEMVDYCNGLSEKFSVGELAFSEEGESHFTDCQKLFLLNHRVLLCCVIITIVWIILRRFVPIRSAKWLGHSPAFYGAILLLVIFVLIGIFAAPDFDRFFVVFHSVLFPGKTNWLFDPATDPVILILPETYFMNCGIMIIGAIITACLGIIVGDLIHKRHQKKRQA